MILLACPETRKLSLVSRVHNLLALSSMTDDKEHRQYLVVVVG